ncbi:MAG: hypothetical protein WBP94_11525 [Rhodomicrobiaceae bacterium]
MVKKTPPRSTDHREPEESANPASSSSAPGVAARSHLLPATNVHPAVAIIGAACYIWIMIMSWQVFDHGTTSLVLAISTVIFLMMIGLPLKCISMARNMTPERDARRDFGAFLEGPVDTYTGPMPGKQAFVEILLPPAALALAATAFCFVALAYSF